MLLLIKTIMAVITKQTNNLLTYQVPSITKGNIIINSDNLLDIIGNMVERKLKMDKISKSPYNYHHVACFWYGIPRWNPKHDFW